jgi:cysteine desulfurase/selenocysteine lyase
MDSAIRNDFPIFKSQKDFVYLDSAATSLKPQTVIDAVNEYNSSYSANVFRGLYPISEKATTAFEDARKKVATFIGANKPEEIVFTKSTTESINLVAYAWGRMNVERGDEIVTTVMEHHSSFVPWQQVALENEASLKVIDIDDEGRLVFQDSKNRHTARMVNLSEIITKKTKIVVLTHISNVLGTINPIKEITREVKRLNPRCLVLVDGAQAVPHMKVGVADLGCDFYAFSGHKMLGPTGVGVLWGRYELLDKMVPFLFGGSMIDKVTLSNTTFKTPPMKFEAGTPPIAEVIGLGAAVDYLEKVGMDKIRKHEVELIEYALEKLGKIEHVEVYGPYDASVKGAVISFNIFTRSNQLVHPHDVAEILNRDGICVRAGHHCAMPLHDRLRVAGSVRASFHIYNTKEDVDVLISGLMKVQEVFK